jgi:hypothetical protein
MTTARLLNSAQSFAVPHTLGVVIPAYAGIQQVFQKTGFRPAPE